MKGQILAAKYTVASFTTGPPRAGQAEISRLLPSALRLLGPPRNFHISRPVLRLRQYRYPSSLTKYTFLFHTTGANRTGPSV